MRDFVDAREETAEEAAAPEHSRPRSGARAGHETGYGREAGHGNEAAPDV